MLSSSIDEPSVPEAPDPAPPGVNRSQPRVRRRVKVVGISAAVLLPVLLALVAVEIYVRATQPYITPATLRSASLEYEGTLFSRHAFPQMPQHVRSEAYGRDISVVMNERGYRGRSFAVPKPEGVVRIVVLGGSAAFDIHADQGRDWPSLVESRLRADGLGNVEVVNAATPGHATWDALGRLYSEIWMFEPDYVVVYEAWNDLKYFNWVSPEKSLLRGMRPAKTMEGSFVLDNPHIYYQGPLDRLLSHSQLYYRLRSRYYSWRLGRVGLEGLLRPGGAQGQEADRSASPSAYSAWGPKQYGLNLRLIADAARDIGAEPVFVTQARLVSPTNSKADRDRISYSYVQPSSHEGLLQAFADADQALRAAGSAEDVRVLDLSAATNGRSELFTDHVHTTEAGSEVIAKEVATFLKEVVAARPAQHPSAPPVQQ